MMTQEELQKWANVQAEDCLRYHPTLPLEAIEGIISDHLRDAYNLGVQEEKIRRDRQDDEEAPPSMIRG